MTNEDCRATLFHLKKKQLYCRLHARLEKVTLCTRLYVPKHTMMRAAVALATSVQLGTPCNRTVFQGTLQVSLLLRHENNTASTLRAQTLVVAKMMLFYFFSFFFVSCALRLQMSALKVVGVRYRISRVRRVFIILLGRTPLANFLLLPPTSIDPTVLVQSCLLFITYFPFSKLHICF